MKLSPNDTVTEWSSCDRVVILQCNGHLAGSDWVDPNDPTVIAERELLGAANKIEAAARKLAQLQARKMPKVCSLLAWFLCMLPDDNGDMLPLQHQKSKYEYSVFTQTFSIQTWLNKLYLFNLYEIVK